MSAAACLATPERDLVSVDLFAGGGGASEGIRQALGIAPIIAVNHDPAAIEMHSHNHPGTIHLCESVYNVDPAIACGDQEIDLLWASPDCVHFSRAKGGKPRKKEIRSLAWVIIDWAKAVKPRVICMENVPEFETWGPLTEDGYVIPERKGETFRAFVGKLEALGYLVDWTTLNAAEYGAPTARKRLFLVARCDGVAPRWPERTHGPGRAHPYRTAAECIDWSIPVPSIFTRKKPLADATQRRIAEGLRRYVLEAEDPYLVDPEKAAWLISTRNGERKGQRPRTRSLDDPMPTVTATGSQGAVVTAWLAKHYTGVTGQDLRRPLGTVTAKDHHSLCAAFLTKYYGCGTGQRLDEPLHTIVSKARFGLVTVTIDGVEYVVTDIGMRMLQPRELARAQGFGDDYVLTGNKAQQTARIGNSVCPPVARALVEAQFAEGDAYDSSTSYASLRKCCSSNHCSSTYCGTQLRLVEDHPPSTA